MMSATRDDGTPFYSPDIAEANLDTIEYWKRRGGEAKHPILRARYSDLVWDFSRVIAKQKPDVSFAKAAVDAYVEAAKLSYKILVQPIHYLERALELAISIGDDERTQTVVDAMFVLYERVAKPEFAGSWPFLFDNLLDNKKIALTEEQQKRIIHSLEEILGKSTDRTVPKEFNPWGRKQRRNAWREFIASQERKRKFHESSEAMGWRLRNWLRRLLRLWLWGGYSRYMRPIGTPE